MKQYMDIGISVLILAAISPLLVGISLLGALNGAEPIIFGKSRVSARNQPEPVPQQNKSAVEQVV